MLKEGKDTGGFTITKKKKRQERGIKGRREREHSKSDQHPPSESSNSKEEVALEADLILAWPKREKEERERTQEGERKRRYKRNGIKRYYKRINLTRLSGWRCAPKVFVLNPI